MKTVIIAILVAGLTAVVVSRLYIKVHFKTIMAEFDDYAKDLLEISKEKIKDAYEDRH